MVTGKGGVGKTTVAAALALAGTRQGRGGVLVEFSDGDAGSRALGPYAAEVEHLVISPDDAITRAAGPLLGSTLLAKLVLGNFAMRRLVRAAPALRELAMLESVRQIVEERPGRRVVVDMPATGHGLAWLRVPAQMAAITSPGPFRTLVEKVNRDLMGPGRCSVVVVTLPETLVLRETVELCQGMMQEVGLDPACLVINQMPSVIAASALAEVQRMVAEGDALGLNPALQAALKRAQALLEARHHARLLAATALRDALDGVSIEPVILPLSPHDPTASAVAGWLMDGGLR